MKEERHADKTVLSIAAATAILSGVWARSPEVSRLELWVFRTVNDLPPRFELPLSIAMQMGSLGAVPVTAGAAWLGNRRDLASKILVAGGSAWVAAKVGKIVVARERPGLLIANVLLRGRPQTGRGFPSGHAAVALAIATVAGRGLGPGGRLAAWVSAGTVAVARMYVGAHLPVDVVGGAALGAAIGTAVVCVAEAS